MQLSERARFAVVAAMAATALVVSVVALIVALDGDSGENRPGTLEVITGDASPPAAAGGSVSGVTGAASGVAGTVSVSGILPATEGASGAMGAYQPVSNVALHALVVLDVCEINSMLPTDAPIDYAAIERLYVDGKHSVASDGSLRTIAGFARTQRDEPIWNDFTAYYDDPTWLDSFVWSAIRGTGAFAGESDLVRRQGIQKGIQNQVMVAWALHEVVGAMAKAADGDFDPASGAPHNWDEGWAFYHGVDPSCAPFATANSRGGNFGTGSAVNDALAAAFTDGVEALVDGDAAGAQAATAEIVRQLTITYVQASIRYAHVMDGDLANGDAAAARVHQAEGWAFFRVIEPLVANVDAEAAATVASYYDLSAGAPRSGAGDAVQAALESAYAGLGITADEVGTLQ